MKVEWTQFKEFLGTRSINAELVSETSEAVRVRAQDGSLVVECSFLVGSAEHTEYVATYAANATQKHKTEVVSQYEKNDKDLRMVCGFATTDTNGLAEIHIPVPQPGRFVAYGEAEFEVRDMGDFIERISVDDKDRLIAWGIALSIDPAAVAPVDDSVVRANGYPMYPVLGHYQEAAFTDPLPPNAKGDVKGGMLMTFQYGISAAEPVGGYGFIPGGMYLCIDLRKASAAPVRAGIRSGVSIDWAEPRS